MGTSLREVMARMGDASARYLTASARRDAEIAEIADAMGARMQREFDA